MLSLVKVEDANISTMSFSSRIKDQASSFSGTSSPIIIGNNLNKVQFSCPFPPIVPVKWKFTGIL